MSYTEQEIDEFLNDGPQMELDVPMVNEHEVEDSLELTRLKSSEKEKERKEKRYFTAFKLIVGCLVFLGGIYIIDVVISVAVKHDVSQITEPIIEIIKTLLFTLSGYLFARKENGD